MRTVSISTQSQHWKHNTQQPATPRRYSPAQHTPACTSTHSKPQRTIAARWERQAHVQRDRHHNRRRIPSKDHRQTPWMHPKHRLYKQHLGTSAQEAPHWTNPVHQSPRRHTRRCTSRASPAARSTRRRRWAGRPQTVQKIGDLTSKSSWPATGHRTNPSNEYKGN